MSNTRTIRISASRLKTLNQCTMAFYYQEVLWMPQTTHWKTKVGSQVHAAFECLMRKDRPRRAALLRDILMRGIIVVPDPTTPLDRQFKALWRFIEWQLRRDGIATMTTALEILDLLRVAFLGIRPYFVTPDANGATKWTPPDHWTNEKRFKMTLPSGAVISGFIDLWLQWKDRIVIIDLKSQGQKFTKADLPHNVQASIYQLAGFKETGIVPTVEFIMLRHGPTTRTPDKHIQRVDPPSRFALVGLEVYIDSVYLSVNQFGLQDAYSSPCADEGFCTRVCSYYKPYPYWLLISADDPLGAAPLSSHLSADLARAALVGAPPGTLILERAHKGCAIRWTESP